MAKFSKRSFHAPVVALAAACGFALLADHAVAQQREQPSQPTIAVVTGDNVFVRSGAAESYYPFGRLNRGALVEVTGEKFNWARVSTRGPSFVAGTQPGEFFGYIVYPKAESGRFRVNRDGKTGVTLGRMDVLAPNLNSNFNPDDSWKPLARLEADTSVTILATSSTTNNTVHRIALPASGEAWISKSYLREANADEIAAWRRAISGDQEKKDVASKPEPKPEAPSPSATAERQDTAVERAFSEPQQAQPTPQVLAREEAEDRTGDRPRPQASDEIVPEKDGVGGAATRRIAERVSRATMEDLEAILENLRRQPAEITEVVQLREMYLDLAGRLTDEPRKASFARARAEQLLLWQEVRERQAELARIRERAQHAAERTEAARLAMYAHADYNAIGRLAASTIYDGQRLPRMLRLQEPGTNRTLAYIQPSPDRFDLIEMIGQWVGIVGEKSYDPALRLNILTPKRIDLLAPQQ